MEVVNIGIIIRNDHNDTFPVALTPQMVQIIQNLLTQIPKMQSKLLGADGKQVTANESIPIIPRRVKFDWAAAYEPMLPEEEKKLMSELQETYNMDEEAKKEEAENTVEVDGKVMKLNPDTGKPAIGQDPQNPFNLSLEATGKANEGMSDEEVETAMKTADQKLVQGATYPEPLKDKEVDQNKEASGGRLGELKEVAEEESTDKSGDCTVKVEAPLELGAKPHQPG